MEAGIADGVVALSLRFFHKLVVGFVEKTLKVDQMFEIFQMLHLFFPKKDFRIVGGAHPSPLGFTTFESANAML